MCPLEPDCENSRQVAPITVLQDKEAIQLVKAYYNIPKDLRQQLFRLAKVLAS